MNNEKLEWLKVKLKYLADLEVNAEVVVLSNETYWIYRGVLHQAKRDKGLFYVGGKRDDGGRRPSFEARTVVRISVLREVYNQKGLVLNGNEFMTNKFKIDKAGE